MATFILFACACSSEQTENKAGLSKKAFEKEIDGKTVSLWTLTNKNGMELSVTNYGGKVVSLLVPDKNGHWVDVCTGYPSIDDYLKSGEIYFGATIGRYGNRIANAKFELDGVQYPLAANNGPNNLHGGVKGFHAVVWDACQVDDCTLELTYVANDMEEGFPGKLSVKVVYQLTDENELKIEYYAQTDKKTVCNLTNHTYFNLNGEGSDTALDHILTINADGYTPTNVDLIPLGFVAPVEGTPLDFRKPTVVGERIEADFEALKLGNGYDHNYVINKKAGELALAATLVSPSSSIQMDVYTDQPGVQFYSGNWMNGTEIGKSRKPYYQRAAICLETQCFPDSPNQKQFPSTELLPEQTYRHTCIYKFR
ncbi:MAG TPA: aldose epimerase family protein [Prolixibacteraceae bacterium]|nr:aldose epimerase family protein [Prolixibacteraceae bacterium]